MPAAATDDRLAELWQPWSPWLAAWIAAAERRNVFPRRDASAVAKLLEVPPTEWNGRVAAFAATLVAEHRDRIDADYSRFNAMPRPSSTLAVRGRAEARGIGLNLRRHGVRRVEDDGNHLAVYLHASDTDVRGEVKRLHGRQWDGERKCWIVPGAQAHQLHAIAEAFGISWHARPPDQYRRMHRIPVGFRDGHFEIRATGDRRVAEILERLHGEWHSTRNVWRIAAVFAEDLESFLEALTDADVAWSDAARTELDTVEQRAAMLAMSDAVELDGGFRVEGIADDLRPSQEVAVAYALRARRTWIADEMGLGKTISALAAIEAAGAYPAVVVVPSIVKLNWRREAKKWIPHRTVHVIEGTRPDLLAHGADLIVVNYDVLYAHLDGIPNPKAVVVDESHYAKEPGSQRTPTELANVLEAWEDDVAAWIREGKHGKKPKQPGEWTGARRTAATQILADRVPDDGLVLLLSGTPTPNGRPRELSTQLQIMGRLAEFGGHAGVRRLAQHGNALQRALRQVCWIGRTKDQAASELPPKQREAIYVTGDPAVMRDYARAEADVLAYLAQKAREKAVELGEDQHSAAVEAAMRAAGAAHLVVIGELRKLSAKAKMPAARAWAHEFLSGSTRQLVVFAHHRDTTIGLGQHLTAPLLIGGISDRERDETVARFQAGHDRVVVCSTKAAGVGITLTAASDVQFVELEWTPAEHDQAEDRCHRIGQDDNRVLAHYLILDRGDGEPPTIDQDMWELLGEKRVEIDRLTKLDPSGKQAAEQARASIGSDLVARLTRRALDR